MTLRANSQQTRRRRNSPTGTSFDVTLTVGGTLVSGTLVANHVWMRRHQAMFEQVPGGTSHFVDGNSRVPSDEKALWRGRLSKVGGWTFGRLGPQPDGYDDGAPTAEFRHALAERG